MTQTRPWPRPSSSAARRCCRPPTSPMWAASRCSRIRRARTSRSSNRRRSCRGRAAAGIVRRLAGAPGVHRAPLTRYGGLWKHSGHADNPHNARPLHRHRSGERDPAVLRPADVRTHGAAASRRIVGGVEHGAGLLPDRAARGLRLRSLRHVAPRGAAPGGPPPRPNGAGVHVPPDRDSTRLDSAHAAGSDPVAARPHDHGDRAALLRGLDHRTPDATMARRHATQRRARSLFPLRREQPRQPARAAELPAAARAAPQDRAAERAVAGGIRHAGRAHAGLCGADLAEPRARGFAAPGRAEHPGRRERHRPDATHLTEFYLWLALGGALGGVFNALIAPRVFTAVAEYPIAIALACLLAPSPAPSRPGSRVRVLDLAIPLAIGLLLLGGMGLMEARGIPLTRVIVVGTYAGLAFVIYGFRKRPLRFALALAAILIANPQDLDERRRAVYAERSFFGINRVVKDDTGKILQLLHGTTVHGMERIVPLECREPLGYYVRSGPIGDVFRALGDPAAGRRVAVAGLGAGALAAYANAGERWTYYEIDPAVQHIATDPKLFCYLHECPAEVRVVLGDARLSLAATGERYDLMILDAYSSDAIPVHLLTREALRLYLERLAPHGVLVLHLSNRYFDLVPLVARLAADAGLVCRVSDS